MRALRRFTVRVHLPERLSALHALSTNLRWSWDVATQDLFESIDPQQWVQTGRDPGALLGSVSPERLDALAQDQEFLARLDHLAADLHTYLNKPLWYQERQAAGDIAPLPEGIGYFSMEFGVAEVLPIYSGGLGILAGDHLKAASDLGLPLIGVGLNYRSGYFRQSLTADGWQHENYPALDPQGLPLRLLSHPGGGPVLVELAMPESRMLRARVWIAQVGRIPLLLLDSDIPENDHDLRNVTDRLYGGDQEHRIKQELLAGIGGIRAIRAYTEIEGHPAPDVFHMNEGHAGFLGLERIRELMAPGPAGDGLDFDTALTVVRSSTVFTTHTPVPAGIDRFPDELVQRYFSDDSAGGLLPGVPLERVLSFGAEGDGDEGDETESRKFNMAHMGCAWRSAPTGCHSCTAVSAAPCSTNCGRDSMPPMCRSARSPTVCTDPPGRHASGSNSAGTWQGLPRRCASPPSGSGCMRSTRAISGGSVRNCGPSWSRMFAGGCGTPGWSAAPLKPRSAGSQRLSIPTC